MQPKLGRVRSTLDLDSEDVLFPLLPAKTQVQTLSNPRPNRTTVPDHPLNDKRALTRTAHIVWDFPEMTTEALSDKALSQNVVSRVASGSVLADIQEVSDTVSEIEVPSLVCPILLDRIFTMSEIPKTSLANETSEISPVLLMVLAGFHQKSFLSSAQKFVENEPRTRESRENRKKSLT